MPLFKKGDRNHSKNYRGICLLAMGSSVLEKVMTERLRWWAEFMKLTDENQSGCRAGRGAADATQVMVRLEEDSEDLRKIRRRRGDEQESGSNPVAPSSKVFPYSMRCQNRHMIQIVHVFAAAYFVYIETFQISYGGVIFYTLGMLLNKWSVLRMRNPLRSGVVR